MQPTHNIGGDMATVDEIMDPAAMVLPASFVNRFQLTSLGGALVRMSFAEASSPEHSFYRAAVMMTAADAKDLAHTILNILGPSDSKPW